MNYLHLSLTSKQSNYTWISSILDFKDKLYYSLILPVLHWKIPVSDFWQILVIYQNPCLLDKKWKLQVGFTNSPWKNCECVVSSNKEV